MLSGGAGDLFFGMLNASCCALGFRMFYNRDILSKNLVRFSSPYHIDYTCVCCALVWDYFSSLLGLSFAPAEKRETDARLLCLLVSQGTCCWGTRPAMTRASLSNFNARSIQHNRDTFQSRRHFCVRYTHMYLQCKTRHALPSCPRRPTHT